MLRTQTTQGIHPIPTRANIAIVAGQLLTIAACFIAASRLHGFLPLASLAIVFGILMNSVYSIIHEAEHAMLFPNGRANELAGVVMALFFPAPFHLLRQGHIGHHLRNRSDDEAFDLYFEGDNVIWRWMVWIGILTGLYYVLVVISNIVAAAIPHILDRRHFKIDRHITVDRPSAAFFESFNPAPLRWIRFEGIAAIVLHVSIVWALRIPIDHYLSLYASFGFMWSAMQYVHHYGTERHVTRGARDLWIFGPIDALWLNHNCHSAHHENPTVPWVHLPRLTKTPRKAGFLPLTELTGQQRGEDSDDGGANVAGAVNNDGTGWRINDVVAIEADGGQTVNSLQCEHRQLDGHLRLVQRDVPVDLEAIRTARHKGLLVRRRRDLRCRRRRLMPSCSKLSERVHFSFRSTPAAIKAARISVIAP